jgi:DNA-binding GntR family transcriptional regulator
VGRLAQNVGISDQGVRNALKRMEALGALKIIRTKGARFPTRTDVIPRFGDNSLLLLELGGG